MKPEIGGDQMAAPVRPPQAGAPPIRRHDAVTGSGREALLHEIAARTPRLVP